MRLAFCLLLALGGCTAGVKLQNHAGQVATCGPYANGFWLGGADSDAVRERSCIDDYQRIGYERMP